MRLDVVAVHGLFGVALAAAVHDIGEGRVLVAPVDQLDRRLQPQQVAHLQGGEMGRQQDDAAALVQGAAQMLHALDATEPAQLVVGHPPGEADFRARSCPCCGRAV